MYGFKHIQFVEHPADVRQGMDAEGIYLGVSLAVLVSFTTYYAITLFFELCRSIASIYPSMPPLEAYRFAHFSTSLTSTPTRKAPESLHGPKVLLHAPSLQDIHVDGNGLDVDSSTDASPHNNSTGINGDPLNLASPSVLSPPIADYTPIQVKKDEEGSLADHFSSSGDAKEEFSDRTIEVDVKIPQDCVTTPASGVSQNLNEHIELADLDTSVNNLHSDASHSPLLLPVQAPLCTIEECDYEDSLQPSAVPAVCLSELAHDVRSTGTPAKSGLLCPGSSPVGAIMELSNSHPVSATPVPPPTDSLHCGSECGTLLIGADPSETLVASVNVEGVYSIMHSALLIMTADAEIDDGETDHDTDRMPVGQDAAMAIYGESVNEEQLSSSDTVVVSAMLLEDDASTCATYASSESNFRPSDAPSTGVNIPPILLAPPSSPAEPERIPQIALPEATNSQAPTPRPFSDSITTDVDYIGPLPKAPRVRVHTPENPDWAVAPDEPVTRSTTNDRRAGRGEKGKQRKNREGAVEEKRGAGSRLKEGGKKTARAPPKMKGTALGQGVDSQARKRSGRLVQAQT